MGTSVYGATSFKTGLGGGSSARTIPGTGFAVPAGVEAILEYNGVYMNIQKNVDRYRINSIDGLGDADVRDSRDVNTEWDGESAFNSYYGGRTIVLNGTIETYSVTKMRDMQQALKTAFIDISNEWPLRFNVGDPDKDHVIYCKKSAPISMVEQQTNMRATRDFQITLRASNPRFLSYKLHSLMLDPVPAAVIATPLFTGLSSVINNGNYWAEPVFRITGPCDSCEIIDSKTGQSFTITSIPADSYYEFDVSQPSLVDQDGDNVWDHIADDSDYLLLSNGSNDLYYIGNPTIIQIFWRDSWM
jgi:Phage tail protein